MINIALVGASGKMGRAVIKEAMNDKSVQVTNFIAVSYTHLTLPTILRV